MSEKETETPGNDRPDPMTATRPGDFINLRIGIEVNAGLIPGTPDPTATRQWFISSDVWQRMNAGDVDARNEFIRIAGESREYAATLEDPRRWNWVRRDWIYY